MVSRMSRFSPPAVFRCLADDTRARIALLIASEEELCVCELTCALQASQPKISRHLAELRNCGLLDHRRQGQWIYYSLSGDLPAWVREILQATLEAQRGWLHDDMQRLDTMGARPVRQVSCC